MKILTLLLSLILSFPFALSAQSVGDLLHKVSTALIEGKDDYAVSLFRQAVSLGADQPEMFYWTHVDKTSTVAPRLAKELATYYKSERNYDKAYLFYKELLQYYPNKITVLVPCAEMEMMRGKDKDAVELYTKVLKLDPDNLQANIFLGNYYYLQAEQDRKVLDDEYHKISSPTRMQYARYRNGLADIFSTNYTKAKMYLLKVLQLFPSTEVGNTLEKIKAVEMALK